MSDFINGIKSEPYRKEMIDTLQKLVKAMPAYKELVFFVKCVRDYYLSDFEKGGPDIAVIGSDIPEELVLASGKRPYWILGGSRVSAMWADDAVPRDTDPVSRSSLGYLKSRFTQRPLILVPLVNDSARKLAYILKSEGFKVHTVHFPPVKNADSIEEWNRQYEACRSAVAFHLKKPLTKRVLKKSQEQIRRAKANIRDFLEISEGVINGTCRMFILGSYYCAENLSEWSHQLECLTARLRKEKTAGKSGKNKVLLLGSPVYFPNFKVPFLIEETGVEVCMQADYTALSLQNGGCVAKAQKADSIAAFFTSDASSAYVKNDSLYEQTVKLISEKGIDGIVYHILKGQIEYDFELGRFEKLFERMDIPVFRLETDYNYQDVEQLRIRLEAFAEVLDQRKYGKGAAAI
ncbi:MAG: 2-hydroxyacyl-CoA dehydratase family protein [Eubacterium sp.]|nr:2-hydroxyacyl-CoA dehydratase family protein [Eubacterium sp.]